MIVFLAVIIFTFFFVFIFEVIKVPILSTFIFRDCGHDS